MASAPFVWREDGRPDWRAMWESFCDLALHGGPPHRGAEQALRGPQGDGDGAASDPAMVAETRRGIWETTGLFSELQSPGWIAITCESRAMAQWLGAAIALENVEARVDGDRLLLPAGPRFQLEDEVKSLVTVVAKTHHYGAVHGGLAEETDGPPADATPRRGFGCSACGLACQVSRPEIAADLDATCPVDGTRMSRHGVVPTRPSASFWHSHGPGQPSHAHAGARPDGADRATDGVARPLRVGVGGVGDGKIALIDALRRRYGRRRAVVATLAEALGLNDPAIDLVLVAAGEDGDACPFGPEVVDATIGVFDGGPALQASDRGERAVGDWRLLVVNTAGGLRVDRARRAAEDVTRRSGSPAVVVVDLATAEGIDVIASWLERELLLEPWRQRRSTAPG